MQIYFMIIGNYLIVFRFHAALQHKDIVTRHKLYHFVLFLPFSPNFRLSTEYLSLRWFKLVRRRTKCTAHLFPFGKCHIECMNGSCHRTSLCDAW